MTYLKEKKEVIQMRRSGRSITEIMQKIKLKKSTVSLWCRDVTLSEKQLMHIAQERRRKNIRVLQKLAKQKHQALLVKIETLVKLGKNDVNKISSRDRFMMGLGLYWGEGYKNSNGELGFTNSDPLMIKFFIQWIGETFEVSKHNLILRISINEMHKDRVRDVEKHWSKITNIPLSQFTKTSLISTRSKKLYMNSLNHYGTLRVKVRKGTDLRRRILGAIDYIKDSTI